VPLLKKAYRLKKNPDFKRVYASGKVGFSRFLVLRYLCRRQEKAGFSRIGFSVSKKLGGAVVRNLIKRRLSACVNDLLEMFPEDYDLVFIAKGDIRKASFSQIKEDVDKLLKKTRFS
jgi:ribonuclease P protein component